MRVRYHLKDFLPHRVRFQKLSAVVLSLLWLSAGTLLAQPAAPTQVWPANNADYISHTPTLSWSSVTGATSYELQVSVNSNMSSPVVNATGITATSKQATGLSAETIYYWRVRAKNASGTSAYSSIRKFTVTGPEWYTVPYVLTTANFPGTYPTGTDNTYTITKSNATKIRVHFSNFNTYAFSYYLQYDDVYIKNPSGTVSQTYRGNLSPFTSIDIPGDTLQIRFVAIYGGGATGWKIDYYQYYGIFPETGEAFVGPTIISPANGATGVSTTPTLSWNSVTGGAEYEEYDLQVSTASDFSTAVVKDSGLTSTTYPVTGLLGATQYYWRVRAHISGGTSSYTTGSFTTQSAPPPAPVLVAPANNATDVAINPTFSWNASATATAYDLQVATDAGFSSVVKSVTDVPSTSTQVTGLSYSTTYYWRVRGKSSSGTGSYSSGWSFTTLNTPSAPTLSSPSNGATDVAINPTLSWSASATATAYDLQVASDAGFTTIAKSVADVTSTSYQVSGLSYSTTYYWRVRAKNAAGAGSYATGWSFMTLNVPDVPTLSSPTNGATAIATNPTLSWSASSTATAYDVEVSANSGFTTIVKSVADVTSTSTQISGLSNSTTYYWHVRAKNAAGASSYSGGWSFTTQALTVPAAPALSSPTNGATSVATNPTLSWSASATATAYDVQVATDAGFTSIAKSASDVTSTSYQVSGLSNSTTYYWRVRAKNAAGAGSYSSGWSFTTVQAPPSAPTLASPSNSATGISTTPTLSWNSVSGATSYELQVSTGSSFTTTVINQTGLTTTSHVATGLGPLTTYYWRVLAKNAAGSSSYSAIWSFTTQSAAPSAPTLASPSNGQTGVSTAPSISWNAVAGATGYELQVSASNTFTTPVIDETNLTASTYQASGLNPLTVYYWRVQAKNAVGSSSYSSTWSFTTNSSVQVAMASQKVSVIHSSPSQSTDYRLFSVPGNLSSVSVSAQASGSLKIGAIFTGTQKTDWRAFNDNGNTADYLVELGPEDLFSTGRGIWAAKRGGLTIPTLSSQQTVANDKSLTISVLANTWNIIGNPFDKSVSWSSVMSANTGLTDGLWEYKGSSGFVKATSMEPFKGYYYKTGVGKTTIKIPYPVAGVTSLPAGIAYNLVDWQLKLSLETALNKDQENTIGIAPSAKAGLDNLDAAKPPLVFDQGFLYFTHSDWDSYGRFASDFRPSLGDGQTWNFEVRNPQKGTATIRISGIESLPANCEVLLINPANGTPHDLRANAAYTYETLERVDKLCD